MNRGQQIYRYEGGGNWAQVPGAAVQVSVGDARNVWVVNAGGQVYKLGGGGGWEQVAAPSQIVKVAVSTGGTRVVALGPSGTVYGLCGAEWVTLPGGLINVSVGDSHMFVIARQAAAASSSLASLPPHAACFLTHPSPLTSSNLFFPLSSTGWAPTRRRTFTASPSPLSPLFKTPCKPLLL